MTETARVVRAYAVTGGLRLPALRAAWHGVAARHRAQDGGAAGPGGDARPIAELGDVTDPGPWQAAERLWADPSSLAFPAGHGPAARLTVARCADGGHLVLLAANRAFAAGGHRLASLVDGLGAAYAAAVGTGGDPAVASFDGGTGPAGAVGALAASEGAAPSDVLLAAYCCLVGRHRDTERPVVAVRGTDGGRTAVRADLSGGGLPGGPSFRELVRQISVSAHEPAPDAPVDAAFVVEGPAEPVLRLPGARVRRLRAGGDLPDTDLTLAVHDGAPRLTGSLEYRTAPSDSAAAPGLLGQLRTLLDAALTDPGTPVAALPLETPERLSSAVREADLTGTGPGSGPPVHERVRAAALATPGAPALDTAQGTVTYAELNARAAGVTDALRALGVGEGAPVALRLPNGPGQAAALLGVLGAGAHAVGLAARDSGERVKAVLAGLRPHCLVVAGEQAAAPLPTWYRVELGGHVLDLDALPLPDPGGSPGSAAPLPKDFPTGPASPVRALPCAGGAVAPPAQGPSGAASDRWAYIAYTSGSTGAPKGIPQTHRTFAQFVDWFAGAFGIGPGSRVAQWAQPGYDASLVELFSALTTGAALCPVPERLRAHPEKLAGWLESERITHFQTVPSFARELLAALDTAGVRLPSLSHLLLAGEALHGELADALRAALPGVRLVNLYGATETVLATWHEVDGAVGDGFVPVGRPIPGRQVLVLDEHDRPCPTGVTGRIVVCGPYVTPGYVGAERPGEAFRPVAGPAGSGLVGGACYRGGDLGRRRWDGLLEFRGRADSRVKIRGTRLELTDVEAALGSDPSVAACAVVARTAADGLVERLVAYVVPSGGPDGDPADASGAWRATLRGWFGRALPAVSFVTLARLPHNTGGKVDRRALADLAQPPR
ncbi:A-domain type II peptide synthetase [Streptomyces spongiicola]|uniref:A-domain type II peptide synthetase n=1 Tax=Streptomyces spongiicola TaxID=1690221 RepID=A0A2S1Z8C1_9ACTN|nr:AMP-binding protein [Streptomyces spongiicola]AWK12595.1 A-domain type II peptide synthetase [Streptomyces spongiicola]GBQ03530.1 A-domain type II peptide synthetase [Streptomyces spongiicola]